MKIGITFMAVILLFSSCYGQTFSDYLDGIPVVNQPKKFRESPYYNWTRYDLPSSINTEINFSNYETIGKIELDASYPLLLVRKYYNNGFHRRIKLVSFDATGNYIAHLYPEYTADGEGRMFSIRPDGKIRIVEHGTMSAVVKTYRYENGQFIEEGTPENTELDVLPDY